MQIASTRIFPLQLVSGVMKSGLNNNRFSAMAKILEVGMKRMKPFRNLRKVSRLLWRRVQIWWSTNSSVLGLMVASKQLLTMSNGRDYRTDKSIALERSCNTRTNYCKALPFRSHYMKWIQVDLSSFMQDVCHGQSLGPFKACESFPWRHVECTCFVKAVLPKDAKVLDWISP